MRSSHTIIMSVTVDWLVPSILAVILVSLNKVQPVLMQGASINTIYEDYTLSQICDTGLPRLYLN